MKTHGLGSSLVAFAALVICTNTAVGADDRKFPSRPVDMIVNFGPGGGADQLGRVMARQLEKELGVPLPVSNVSGAAGTTGLTMVASNAPDGYTLGTMTGLSVSSWAAGQGKLKVGDFAYVGVVQSSPSMLFVKSDSPLKTYQQFLDAAKANPKKIRIATAGYSTLDDIAVKYLSSQGYQVVNVPYANPGERYISPLGGHTEVLFEEPGDILQFLQAKQLVPIGVFGATRHPKFPDVPASGEFGQKIDLPNWRAIVTSAQVPGDKLRTLNGAVVKVLATKEWQEFCDKTYTCISPMNPEDSKAFVQRNFNEVAAFMKEFGLSNMAAK